MDVPYDCCFERDSLVVGSDGTIHIIAQPNALYAIDLSGTIKWEYGRKLSEWIERINTPVLGLDGTIYIGADSGERWNEKSTIHALTPNGTLKWKYNLPFPSWVELPPIIGSNGTIFIYNGEFYAINPDGTLKFKWERPDETFGHSSYTSLCISSEGVIYIHIYDYQKESFMLLILTEH